MTAEEILAAQQAIIDAADAEDRNLSDEEVQRYEELETQLRSAQRTAEIRARQSAYMTPVRSDVGVHVAAPKHDDTLERAFSHYLRSGRENADLVELRAQGEAVGSEGGYLVPDTFRQKIVDRMKAFGGIANVVEEITTDTGAPMRWVTVDDTANTGEIVAEGGTFASGADIVFGTANLGAYSYAAGGAGAAPLRLSLELIQDSAVDIEGLVSRKLGERIARLQATHLVTGNGVAQPQGIVDGLTGVEMSSGGPTYNDLVGYIHDVDPAYRANARWAFNDASLETIRKMTDAAGDPLWRPADATMANDLGGGTLMGYPVTIDQAFGNIVGTNGADDIWGVFGDLREGYVIRRVRDIALLVNPYERMAYRQVEYSAWARMDAVQQNTNAYIALAGYTA